MMNAKIEERKTEIVPSQPRYGLKRVTPFLLTLIGGLVCYGLFVNRGLGLSVIGYSIAPAERVLQGEVPYRDFLFNYTPGILWVNALLMKAFGVTLMATRYGLFAFKLATLLMLYYAGRRLLTNRWVALLPVALTLAWLGHQQLFNVYPDSYLVLFALAGLLCMLNYDRTGGKRWLVLCGLAVGTVFLFKYNVGVLLLASGSLAVLVRELMTRRGLLNATRAVAIYACGFGSMVALLVGYLSYNHALSAMVSHFLHHAAEYSESRSVGLPWPGLPLLSGVLLLPAFAIGVLILFKSERAFTIYWLAVFSFESRYVLHSSPGKAFGESLIAWVDYFPPLVFAVALALGVWQLKKTREVESWWRVNGPTAITGLFAFAVYLEVFPRADHYHLVRVLPPVFLFLVLLVRRLLPTLEEFLRKHTRGTRQAAGALLATPILFLLVLGVNDVWLPQFDSVFHLADNRELAIPRGRGIFVEDRQAELTEGLVQLIQENSSPDDYIFSFAQRGSGLYFLAARRNPTRFLWWRSVGISAEEREGVMTMINNRRAKLIIVQDIEANKEIQDFIGVNYERIGAVYDIAVYGLKNGTQASLPVFPPETELVAPAEH
jgi:4-amino-4-deoxy-L-arabinose transferase-like glycosyltransferase